MKYEHSDVPVKFDIKGIISEKKGTLYAIEDFELGIDIKRVFYITDFTDQQHANNRGNHSHEGSLQFLINIKGFVEIKIININTLHEYNFVLDSPDQCLFLPPDHHIFMNSYTNDSVMIVLCDKNYEEDRINDFHLPECLDGFREASEFLGLSLKEVIDRYNEIYADCPDRMKFKQLSDAEFTELFKNREPTSDELLNFYRETDNYILELTEYHSTYARKHMTNTVVEKLNQFGSKSVLDYGCGIGEDSIVILENDIFCTLCDLSSKTLSFAKWRLARRGLSPQIIEIEDIVQSKVFNESVYDAILCFEVLMHVPEPLETLKKLQTLLADGGYLFLTHRFIENYSLALEKNTYLHSEIDTIILDMGFELIEEIPVWTGKILFIYRKTCN